MDIRAGDPLRIDFELEAGQVANKTCRQMQRQDEGEQGDYQRKDANVAITAGEKYQ